MIARVQTHKLFFKLSNYIYLFNHKIKFKHCFKVTDQTSHKLIYDKKNNNKRDDLR